MLEKSDHTPYRVVEASYVVSSPNLRSCPDPIYPEIAIAGRSNVGKSSLINLLCNQKNLAKTSRTPGKTQMINYFHLRIEPGSIHLHLVDLPGYGYTKTGKTVQEQWGKTMGEFLERRKPLIGILQLVDSRHEPQTLDLQMREWITHSNRAAVTILTKTDKLKKNAIQKSRAQTIRALGLSKEESCILTSVLKRQGIREVTNAIVSLLQSTQNTP